MPELSTPLLEDSKRGQTEYHSYLLRQWLSAECFWESGKLSEYPPLLCACTSLGHIAIVALVFDNIRLAVILFAVSALLLIIHVVVRCQASKVSYPEPPSPVKRASSTSILRRSFSRFFHIAYHLTPPMWLVVGCMFDDTGIRMLAGMLLVSSPRLPWWEVHIWLMIWLGVFIQYGEPSSAYLCAPAFLLVLIWLNDCPNSENTNNTHFQNDMADIEIDEEVQSPRNLVKSIPDWSPPTVKEERTYRRVFGLNDELLGVYACSIQTDLENLTHYGRLYISSGHVCFHGKSVMSRNYQMTIERTSIQEVKCEASQGDATLILSSPTFIRGSHTPVMAVQLFRCERGLAVLAAFLRVAQEGNEEDDDFAGSTDAEDAGNEDEEDAGEPSSSEANALQHTSSAQIFADGEPFQKLFDAHLPELTLEAVSSELIDKDWTDGSVMVEYIKAEGGTEVSCTPCIVENNGNFTAHIRELTTMMPLPPTPMFPRVTKMTITYIVSLDDEGTSCTIEASAVSHDVPFGSNFLIQDRIQMVRSEGGDGIQATKSCRVVFLKSVGMLKRVIKSTTVAKQVKSGETFVSFLRNYARANSDSTLLDSGTPSENVSRRFPSDMSNLSSCCFSVWELQRRTTVFHSDWRAPFLPHEGKFKWRWVDDSYRKHHWIVTTSRRDAAAASYPPLDPGDGWIQIGDWTVSMHGNGTDSEGWQYSIDFYRNDSLWSASYRGCSVRRRLWTCAFAAAE